MDGSLAFRLAAVLVLVLANGFFVAAEFALVSARRTRIDELVQGGDRLARSAQKAQRNLDRAISGTQLGITLASLGLGWIGEPALAGSLEALVSAWGFSLSTATLHTVAVTLAFLVITYLHIVLGELAPKTVALLRPEATRRLVAGPLLTFNRVMWPAIWMLNGSARLFLRLIRVPTARHGLQHAHSPDEIEMLVRQSLREGVVEEDEQAMIEGVFELTHTVAREVMTPRPDIQAVRADATVDQIFATVAESGFSRLPVVEDSLDEILGVVVVKDLISELLAKEPSTLTARDVMREPVFVPDTKPIDDLLAELQARTTHMAVVVDEFGGTDGIVTLEDLLEEIVGEIYDEHDVSDGVGVTLESDGSMAVDGGFSFSDLLSDLDIDGVEDAEEYDTVAGYVIGVLGRIPEQGDRVPLGDAELEVTELTDRRITRLALRGVSNPSPTAIRDETKG